MAGRRKVAPLIPTNSLVASAVRYTGQKAPRIFVGSQDWQREAYRHYGINGEARFAAEYYAHSMSRVTLHAAEKVEGVLTRLPPESVGSMMLEGLFNGPGGQAHMLGAIGTHLTIAGECYVVGRTVVEKDIETGLPTGAEKDVWEVVSTIEMHVQGTAWTIQYGANQPDVPLKKDDVVIRIWRPSPAQRFEADSPFRSLLPVLSEIEWLTKHIFAQTSSRLAGAGILFLDQDMTFPPPPEVDGVPQQVANEAEAMTLTLADNMLAPIGDPGNPAALVPIVVTSPGDSIAKARLMHFWTDLDAKALEMRMAAIHRFALGMDLPVEKVLGQSSNQGTGGGSSNGVSHWGSWQIDEETIKLHIEPMVELVVNALVMEFLRPLTQGTEYILADTSALKLRPDRSKEAMELWDRLVISTAAMLRENGFDPKDMPGEDEVKQRLLQKVAVGSATPDQVGAALRAMGVDLGPATVDGSTPPEVGNQARPAPSLEDHPTRPKTPEYPDEQFPDAAALLAASEGLVYRALERGGNRLRQMGGKPVGVPAYETHTLVRANGSTDKVLDDAFSCAPMILAGIADHDKVVPILHAYCAALMAEQAPHERARLSAWLDRSMAS